MRFNTIRFVFGFLKNTANVDKATIIAQQKNNIPIEIEKLNRVMCERGFKNVSVTRVVFPTNI